MRKTDILLIFIFLFAVGIRMGVLPEYFYSSDNMNVPLMVIDSIPKGIDSFFSTDNYGMNNPLRLIAYPYSIVQPYYYLFMILLFSTLGVAITELNLILLSIVTGSFSIFAAYLLISKLYNSRYGVYSALIVALLPIHILQSRFLASSRALNAGLQLFTLYYAIKFFEEPKKHALQISVLLSLVMLSTIVFPSFFIALVYVFIVYNKKIIFSISKLKEYLIEKIPLLKVSMLPIITFSGLLLFYIVMSRMGSGMGKNVGLIGHILTKNPQYGIYLFPVLNNVIDNIGPVLFLICLITLPFGLKDLFNFDKKGILLALSFAYIFPFVFTNPSPGAYMIYGTVPLALFGIIKMCELLKDWKLIRNTLLITVILATLFSSISAVYNVKISAITDISGREGNMHPDYGVKAIAYWIRTNTDDYSAIFTDESIEPNVGKYYFHRKVYSLFDSDESRSYEFYLKHKSEIDYLVISEKNLVLYPGYYIIAESVSNGFTYYVLGEENKLTQIIPVSAYNSLYDSEFANVVSIINAPNYVSQFPDWM